MKIIKGTEAIDVVHPVFMLIGQPGIGKSSLAMSMRESLLLDFDMGVHRSINRKDAIQIPTWAVVEELLADASALEPYAAIIVDTVGRCLDKLAVEIMAKDAKMGRGGALTQQGWGQLKSRFQLFLERVKAQGKDVLLVAHDKEDKGGDTVVVRADIQGGSYGEVMKSADFVGYLYMNGRERILDFNPTDRWVGKNPAGWAAMKVPEPGKATEFFGKLYAAGRESLGKITEASADVLLESQKWQERILACDTAAKCNVVLEELQKLSPILKPQVATMLWGFAKNANIPYNGDLKRFVDPAPATTAPADDARLLFT